MYRGALFHPAADLRRGCHPIDLVASQATLFMMTTLSWLKIPTRIQCRMVYTIGMTSLVWIVLVGTSLRISPPQRLLLCLQGSLRVSLPQPLSAPSHPGLFSQQCHTQLSPRWSLPRLELALSSNPATGVSAKESATDLLKRSRVHAAEGS